MSATETFESSTFNAETPRIAIIGAGMSGILMGIKLKEAGIEDFTLYEKADTVGGTWRENTYPGIACASPLTTTAIPLSRPRLEPPVFSGQGDPHLLRALRREVRDHAAHTLQHVHSAHAVGKRRVAHRH